MRVVATVIVVFLIVFGAAVAISAWASVQIEDAQATRRVAEASIAASEAIEAQAQWTAISEVLTRSVEFADEVSGELILLVVIVCLVGVIVYQVRFWVVMGGRDGFDTPKTATQPADGRRKDGG